VRLPSPILVRFTPSGDPLRPAQRGRSGGASARSATVSSAASLGRPPGGASRERRDGPWPGRQAGSRQPVGHDHAKYSRTRETGSDRALKYWHWRQLTRLVRARPDVSPFRRHCRWTAGTSLSRRPLRTCSHTGDRVSCRSGRPCPRLPAAPARRRGPETNSRAQTVHERRSPACGSNDNGRRGCLNEPA
jgi:hypothetical protein